MVIKSVRQSFNPSASFNLTVILPIAHDLLEVRLITSINPNNLPELELEYGRHEYISEKDIKKENWECFLIKKKTDMEIPTRANTKLELVRQFKSDTHYLFRVVTIKH